MNLFRLKDCNYTNQKFNGSALIPLALVLACFAISPVAQAVVPAPDGGYPGGNTAEGQNALFSLTSGGFNTGVGFLSLRSNTTGQFNTAVGAGALLANIGEENTATGAGALLSSTTGFQNTANGAFALLSNTTGFNNTAIGWSALLLSTGNDNTAVGRQALLSNTTGSSNTAVGRDALGNSTGSGNTGLGVSAGSNISTASNVTCIGANVGGANVSDSCFIGHIRGVTTANPDAIPVVIDSTGQLGTMSSSRRFKKEVKSMDNASEAILALKPVTFHYKSDKTGTAQFGLIAEEVAALNPDLVVRDESGEVYTVRYDAVNAMLLNEFLKEHRKNEEQGRELQKQAATIAKQQKQIEALAAGLQKVSAQVEMSRTAPQMIVKNQ